MAKGRKKEPMTPEERLQAALVPESERPYKVPGNWCWVKVGALSDLHRGVSYKKQDAHVEMQEQDCLILRGGNILEGTIETEAKDNVYVNRSLVQNDQLLQPYDIVIVSSTGSSKVIGRAGVSYAEYTNVAFGAFLTLVRPASNAVKPFIAYYFQSDIYRERIRKLAAGININNIKANYITESPVPFPPFPEQQRIVDRIESLFAKLDEARQKAQDALDIFEPRKAAILHKAFTGELTAPWRKEHGIGMESWKKCKIGTYAQVKGGKRLPKGHSLVTERTEHPYLRITDFGEGTINVSDLHYITEDTFSQIKKYTINKGDVYLSIVGSIGKAGVVPEELDGANLTENAAKIISNQTVPRYLSTFLTSPEAQRDIQERIRSATLGKLSLLNIKDIETPIPTMNEQLEIVRLLDELLAKEQQAKDTAQKVLEQIDLIKKAVLARAFRGELGTNDPNEESTAELLKQMV